MRAAGNRNPRWGAAPDAAGSDRSRPSRDAGRPTGEWTPRGRDGDNAGPRRGEGARFGERRPERPEFGRPEFGRPEERRWERRPERGARFERRPDAGRPPRPSGGRPMGARPSGPRPTGARSFGAGAGDAAASPRFLPRGSRPRPPAELIGLERRGPAGAGRAPEAQEGDHFAGAAPSDLIWGRHSAQAALESGRPIHRIWCTPEMRFSPRFLQLLREAKASGVLVEEVTWARLGQISGGAVHQGIVLQPAAAETLDLPSLIEGCRTTGESPLLIAVDGLTDPQNLGAIVRSAEALGAHGLVLPQRRNAGLTGSVAKVAAGALEHLPVARVVNLNRSLEALKDEGYRVIGLASEGSITLEEADLEGPLVVVTGSEGDGLSLLTRRHCDQLVRIPLRGTTPSLNASVATALLLYEIARRGWMQGLRGNSPAPRLVRPALPAPAPATEPAPALEPSEAPEQANLMPAAAGPHAEAAADSAPDPRLVAGSEAADAAGALAASSWHAAIGAEPLPSATPEGSTPSEAEVSDAVTTGVAVPGGAAIASDETSGQDDGQPAAAPEQIEAAGGSPDAQTAPTPWSAAVVAADATPEQTDAREADPAPSLDVEAIRPPVAGDAGLNFDGDIRL